jgi:hypothetical protein
MNWFRSSEQPNFTGESPIARIGDLEMNRNGFLALVMGEAVAAWAFARYGSAALAAVADSQRPRPIAPPRKTLDQLAAEAQAAKHDAARVASDLTSTITNPTTFVPVDIYTGKLEFIDEDSARTGATVRRPFLFGINHYGPNPFEGAYFGLQHPTGYGAIKVEIAPIDLLQVRLIPDDPSLDVGSQIGSLDMHAGPVPAGDPPANGRPAYIGYQCNSNNPTELFGQPPAYTTAMK